MQFRARHLVMFCVALAGGPTPWSFAELPAPVSPAGQRLEWLLDGINQPSRLDAHGALTDNLEGLVSAAELETLLGEFHDEAGTLELLRVRELSRFAIIAICAGSAGQHWELRLHTEPQPPYRLDVLSYRESDYWNAPAWSSWSQVDSVLAEMSGRTAYSVWRLGENQIAYKVHGSGSSVQLAIGSAFKLYVLGAIAHAVTNGDLQWTNLLPLRDEWKAIGSGVLRERPAGDRLSVVALATEMMANSDNTATDHLIHAVGRESVEAWMIDSHSEPARNQPFLTAREFFGLKHGDDDSLRNRYCAATSRMRRGCLEQASRTEPVRFPQDLPVAIDAIEWFASTDDLCRVMFRLRNLSARPGLESVMQVISRRQRGLRLDPDHWSHVAYKGGREVGVLNLTWLLQRADGAWFAISFSFNDSSADIDTTRAASAALSAIRIAATLDAETFSGTPSHTR